jgi:hypothetical protein
MKEDPLFHLLDRVWQAPGVNSDRRDPGPGHRSRRQESRETTALLRGPARLLLRLPTNPQATAAALDQAIQQVPSLQPGLSLFGRDTKTRHWVRVGKITRVWRDGKDVCQEADIDSGVELDALAPVYTRIDVLLGAAEGSPG